MFRVTLYLMISKTELGRVGYRKKYRVAGRVQVLAKTLLKLEIEIIPGCGVLEIKSCDLVSGTETMQAVRMESPGSHDPKC